MLALFLIAPKRNTHMSSDRWMDKQIVVYLYNGNPTINKMDQIANGCCNMIESQKFYVNWKNPYPKKNTYHILHFYEIQA